MSSVGIGGLTLLGGFGHLLRRHGLTVDNLRAVDLVTADGDRLRVDADSDPELFWGLRGGGGSFGVATAFEYELYPVGPMVLGGPVYWPLEQAPEVLGVLRDLAPKAPDEMGAMLVAHHAPPMPFLAASDYGRPALGLLLTWTGDPVTGERFLEPLRRTGTPLGDLVRPVPYVAVQSLLDRSAPFGASSTWRSWRLPDLSDGVTEVVQEAVASATSPLSLLNGWVIGGAASRVDPGATAVGAREPGYELRAIAVWRPDPADAPHPDGPGRHRDWVHRTWDALRPYADGRQFATFLSDEGPAGVRRAYRDRLPRLVALKDRFDPTDVFGHGTPIRPSTRSSTQPSTQPSPSTRTLEGAVR